MDLFVMFLIVAGTAVVLFQRARQDLEGNRPYVYLLGALLAVSLGLLMTERYDQDVVQWVLPLVFSLFVLIPHLLIHVRDRQFQSGQFHTAAFVQGIVQAFVWSRNEQEIGTLAGAAKDVREGNVDRAREKIEEVEGRSGRDASVTETLIQVRILVAGQNRNWRSVVREFDTLSNQHSQKIWTPILVYMAQACIETEHFRRAEQMLNELEDRNLSIQQQVAVHTIRVGYLMLQGKYQAGSLLIEKIQNEFEEVLPEPYSPYWRARGSQAAHQFDEARNFYELALENVDPDQNPEWKEVIEERVRELEIEENRHRTRSRYRYQGDELDEPVDEWGGVDIDSEPVVEAEPLGEPAQKTQPPAEVVQFIQRVNQFPVATTTLLVIIGVIFLGMWIGVQKEYPEGSEIPDPTYDPVSLLVFGMKSDFMMNETYEKRSTGANGERSSTSRERIQEASNILSTKLSNVENLNGARKKLNDTLDQTGHNIQLSEDDVRNLWVEARYADMFGFDREGNIDFPKHQYWRLATATLLHIGWIHLLLNGYALWILGKLLENIYGLDDYLIIYLISGLTGSIASWKFGVGPSSAGASGAIFGLLGAAITLTLIKGSGIPDQIRKRLAWPLLFLTGLNLALGFVIPNIDNAGHIGGLIGGLIFGYLLPVKGERVFGIDAGVFRYVKWSFLTLLVSGYLWAIYKGLLFVSNYIDQIP